jgi:hypothetical protein
VASWWELRCPSAPDVLGCLSQFFQFGSVVLAHSVFKEKELQEFVGLLKEPDKEPPARRK